MGVFPLCGFQWVNDKLEFEADCNGADVGALIERPAAPRCEFAGNQCEFVHFSARAINDPLYGLKRRMRFKLQLICQRDPLENQKNLLFAESMVY